MHKPCKCNIRDLNHYFNFLLFTYSKYFYLENEIVFHIYILTSVVQLNVVYVDTIHLYYHHV